MNNAPSRTQTFTPRDPSAPVVLTDVAARRARRQEACDTCGSVQWLNNMRVHRKAGVGTVRLCRACERERVA